jgi:hypothetical protein
MGVFLRWSDEEAKEAYDLMLLGRTAEDIACRVPFCDKGATRNAIIGLVHRYRTKHELPRIKGNNQIRVLGKAGPKPKRERKFVVQTPRVVKSVKVRSYEEAIEPLWVRFMDLERHHCRWPVGLGHGLDSTYCGHTKAPASSYCNAHTWRAYNDIPREG